jgi:hypothetical protein
MAIEALKQNRPRHALSYDECENRPAWVSNPSQNQESAPNSSEGIRTDKSKVEEKTALEID